MKHLNLALMALAVNSIVFAADEVVQNVVVRQIQPWGQVIISVTIAGSSNDVEEADCVFFATNSATKAMLTIEHVIDKGIVSGSGSSWTRKYIWDAPTDVGAVKIDDVALTVYAGVGGVQLWEGGPYWAECNVGAAKPEEYGCYFWWGDTVGCQRNGNRWIVADSSSAGFLFGRDNCFTYGKDVSTLQSLGYIDSTKNLVAPHDAATANLGAPWRMPTDLEMSQLIKNCTTTWTSRNGVAGCLVSGKGAYSSRSIFLPAAGYDHGAGLDYVGSNGYYWSSTLFVDGAGYAEALHFYSGDFSGYCSYRYSGQPIRPLRRFIK